jgi:hypothetical protein
MPTITDNQIRTVEELIGEGNVYVNVTAPADGAELALVAGEPATGTWVGLTSAEAVLKIKETIKGRKIEQSSGEVAHRITEEMASLKLTMAEADATHLKLALNGATSGTTALDSTTWVKGGGKTRIVPGSVVLVSPIENEDGSTRYQWVMFYKARPSGEPEIKYSRAGDREIEVTFEAIPDITRTRGDQLYQFVEDDPPA